jgi:DNA polymerase-3 subunit alpha
MTIPFQELRWHTEYSTLTATGRLDEHIARAHEAGYGAVCLTEIDSMRATYLLHEGLANFNKEKKSAIRPIFGIEFSVCPDASVKGLVEEQKAELAAEGLKGHKLRRAIWTKERELGLTRTWRLCARAQNKAGLMNLYKLSSIAWTDGHFIRPRVDFKLLAEYSEGVSVSVGGPESLVLGHLVAGETEEGLDALDALREAFEGRMYLEIQPFEHVERHNVFAMKLHKRLGVPLIAVNDVLYPREDDTDAHQVVLCMARGKTLLEVDAPKSPVGRFIRTGDQMAAAFAAMCPILDKKLVREAIERTVEVAEEHQTTLEIDRFKALVPQPDLPADMDDYQYLKSLCLEGWHWRDIDSRAKEMAARDGVKTPEMRTTYMERLKKELKAITNQKFTPYFLIVRDLIYWARSQGIMTGPGRGSAAGSLVCYLLGITAIDPIEHRLMFERFISPNRIDMPDIDMDYEDNRRQEVIDYLHKKYGADRVCHIVTFGRMRGKAALRDVSRVMGIPGNEVSRVTSSIVERSSGDERVSQTVEDSFKEFKVCQDFDAKYPQVLPLVKKLEGTMRQTGVHAAGIVACGVPLNDVIPIERHKRNNIDVITTCMDMWGSEAHGLLKLDVLGLRTLSVIKDALNKIKERHGRDIDPEALPLNDKAVLQNFTDHHYVGIFQYDSTGAHAACEGIPFTSFEDVAALTALNRPGTMRSGLATEYKKRKLDPDRIKPFHPLVDNICSDTLGVLVYQEQVIRIFVEVAGYEPGTADSLRKKIAKKWGDEALGKERELFVKGATERGVDPVDAGKLMDNITFFGSYGFNKSHASAYGAIAYWGMWLKTYFATEFMWALMMNEPDRDEISRFSKECARLDIKVLPPDINVSGVGFTIDNDGHIRSSLADIKNVGEKAVQSIVGAQPFDSIVDLLSRVSGRNANSRVLGSLVKAGAMKSLLPNTKWALENVDEWHGRARKKKAGWEDEVSAAVEASASEPDYSEEDLLFLANEVAPLGSGAHPIEVYRSLLEGPLSDTKWLSLDDELFWGYQSAYIRGTLIEIKYNQVGDFDTVEPSEEEKLRKGWGKRYANVNIEDESGIQHRVKIDIDIFEEFRHIIDKGVGTCVAMHIAINKRFHNLRCHFMADLEEMRQKVKAGAEFTGWERCFIAPFPVGEYTTKAIAGKLPKGRGSFRLIGLITSVKQTFDKKGNQMCFFGVQDCEGFCIEVVVFSSVFETYGEYIVSGAIVEMALRKDKTSYLMSDDGIIDILGSLTAS